MKKYLSILLAAILCSCESLRPEQVEVVELGIAPEDIIVTETAGEDGVRVIADRAYSLEIIEGSDWLSPGISASDTLSFSFKANGGFRRSGRIRISADGRSDEIVVKQKGIYTEKVLLSEHNLTAPAAGESFELRIHSNLPSDYFSVSSSSDDAVTKLLLENYILSFGVSPTTNRDKRTYTVTVYYKDGWGETVSDTVSITQEAFE